MLAWLIRTPPGRLAELTVAVEERWVFRPGQFDAINAPTLLLAGSESPADLAKATENACNAIPDARIHTLAGHAHMAHKSDPATVGTLIREFIST